MGNHKSGQELQEYSESLAAAREISRLLIEGVSDADAVDDIRVRFPQVDAAILVRAASDRLGQAAQCDRSVVIGWALEAYREVYRRSLEAGEHGDAIKAVRELVALAQRTDGVWNDDEKKNEISNAINDE